MTTSRQILLEAEDQFNRAVRVGCSDLAPALGHLCARYGAAPVLEAVALNHFIALQRLRFLEAENARLRASEPESVTTTMTHPAGAGSEKTLRGGADGSR